MPVENWTKPKTIHELRTFLGVASFYRKFIQGFSHIATPLTNLLKKGNPFEWTDICQNAI